MLKSYPTFNRSTIARSLFILLLSACATATSFAEPPATVAVPQPTAHPDLGHEHIPFPKFPHADYNSNPPSSGPHTSYTAPWGQHAQPLANEVLLHNLEHGGVVIGYRCAPPCADLVQELAELIAPYKITILAPNPTLDNRIGLSAWGHTLVLDQLDDAGRQAILDFLAAHHGVDHHPTGAHPHSGAPENSPADSPQP